MRQINANTYELDVSYANPNFRDTINDHDCS